jgi:hypothetical protein
MKNKTVSMTLFLIIVLSLSMVTISVFAGHNNNNYKNGKSAERGTGKANGLNGCAPPTQAGSVNIDGNFPNLGNGGEIWAGAYCCASNHIDEVSELPTPNQCCNPPDYLPSPPFDPETPTGEHVPGNHCLCFELRGFQPLPLE